MKKIIALSAIALALLACNKEIAEQQIAPSKEGLVTITATTEDLSKVVLDMNAETNLVWADTDAIAVYDGSSANTFTIKSNSGASAVFEGSCDTAAPMLYAVYPAAAYSAPATDAIKVEIPASQTIPDGGCVDPEALVAVGYAAPGQPMAFKQVCALLKLTVTGSDIMEIVIKGKGLAGTAAINADGTINASGASLTDEIVLHPASGMFAPGGYFVAVAPGTTPAGTFSINYNTVSATATKTASSEVRFERAKGLDAGPLTGFTKTVIITTMAELFNWNASRSTADIEDVKIGADIDMEGEPWVPKDFTGTFDGQGHKLFNLNVNRTSNACFFNTVKGTVKDVTFGTSTDSSFIIQNNPDDDGSAWRYAGLITRLSEGAVLEKVTSYVPVSVASESKSKTRVGGLVAIVAGDATIKNCVNNGKVTIEATAPAAAGAAGGIVGWADANISFTNVTNNGDITIKNSFVTYTAGILPCDNYGCTFDTCANNGNISISGEGARGMCVAGIVGDATDSNVKSCSNSGKIEISIDGEMKVGGIVGRAFLGCTVTGCTNSSTAVIVSNPASATKRTFMGGIVGNSPAANNTELTIENCKNYASFSTENAQVASVSGIAGYLNGAGKVIIRGCENFGDMSNNNGAALNGSSAAASYVSGIVAYLSTSMLDGSCVDGCTNRGAIFSKNRNINYIGAILPILKADTAVSVKDCHNYGTVTRDVNIRTQVDSNNDTYYSVGGIIGKVDGANAEVSGCVNHASAAVWENAGGGSAYPKAGGVIAYIVKAKSVSGCRNEASVTYDNTATGGSFGVFGGVIGHAYATQLISDCYNSGTVFANRSQVNRAGGIVGTLNNSSITGCTNEGAVTISNSAANWQAAGGIIGFAEGSGENEKDIVGNVNTGAVSISVNTNNARCCAGGILGMPASSFNISNNVNRGSVSGTNANTSAPYCYVGGIIGQDKGATSVSTIIGNKSYGEVKNDTGSASYSAAGGLIGNCDVSDMSGSVFCIVSGTNAGAVAGVNTKAITATICDAVTVNGVTKAAASDEGVWLCPSNTGTITPTYVAHSSSE
ncbi:MAG: hypothetical protein J6S97_00600 [Bacteroidales bacterium]|nr:hypothetical protein [Bacteroidales bacterium]